MIVKAPEYDSNDDSSSANIRDTEDKLPERKRRQTIKKGVKLMQELLEICSKDNYLHLKVVATNKFLYVFYDFVSIKAIY